MKCEDCVYAYVDEDGVNCINFDSKNYAMRLEEGDGCEKGKSDDKRKAL